MMLRTQISGTTADYQSSDSAQQVVGTSPAHDQNFGDSRALDEEKGTVPPAALLGLPEVTPSSPATQPDGSSTIHSTVGSASGAPLKGQRTGQRTRQENSQICQHAAALNVRRDSSSESSSETAVSSPLIAGFEPSHAAEPSGLFRDVPAEEAAQPEGSTNERLLQTAFVSFMSFALLQLAFALIAGSQAMMGDSAAMIVDSLTYLFNWVAERRKNHLDDMVRGHANPARSRRKLELHMEILPPLLSVTTLIVVIAFVLRRSIRILLLDLHRSRNQQSNPNVGLMMVFSILNLFLDGLNVFCFAQAQHLMGYDVKEDSNQGGSRTDSRHQRNHQHQAYEQLDATPHGDVLDASDHVELSKQQSDQDYLRVDRIEGNDGKENAIPNRENGSETHEVADSEDQLANAQHQQHANLNMCSAYTHVFADTLRSFAVILAALVAELFPNAVTPEEADATAALIVSVLILLSLVPLCRGLISSVAELQSIRADERADALFASSQYNHNAIQC